MPDQWAHLRSLPFDAVASQLGIDLSRFKHRGNEWHGYCIIHGSKTNNNVFHYNDSGKFKCFGCPAKGSGPIDLAMQVLAVGFQQAVERLGSIKPSSDTRKPPTASSEATEAVLKPFDGGKYRKFAVPCPWLEERIPDAGIREKYGVFCYNNPARKSAYSGRVMIPIKDVDGRLYGYLGRNIHTIDQPSEDKENPSPKYLFPRDFPKSRFLFGCHELRQHLADSGLPASSKYKEIYLLESPFAVLKFASLGLPAVSPFGWNVSTEQIGILKSLTRGVVFLPDRNKYQDCLGMTGLIAQSLWLRFPLLPDTIQDPEQMTMEQIQALTR